VRSAEQEQQAGAHHPAQPPRAPDRRGRGVHRLHPPDAVPGRHGPPTLQPIRGDARVAPPRRQVAQRPLPLLGGPSRAPPVIQVGTHTHTRTHTHTDTHTHTHAHGYTHTHTHTHTDSHGRTSEVFRDQKKIGRPNSTSCRFYSSTQLGNIEGGTRV